MGIKVAVIEDDIPTSKQIREWIRAARPGIEIDAWFNRDDAEAAIAREATTWWCSTSNSGASATPASPSSTPSTIGARHAGAGGLGHAGRHLPQHHEGARRLGLPAEDHLRGSRFHRHLPRDPARLARARSQPRRRAGRRRTFARPAAPEHAAVARQARQPAAHRAAHPRRALPAARRGRVLRRAVPGGKERAQPRQHPQAREHHPRSLPRTRPENFDRIENIPMRGFRWAEPASKL
jgi:hypothetical protein